MSKELEQIAELEKQVAELKATLEAREKQVLKLLPNKEENYYTCKVSKNGGFVELCKNLHLEVCTKHFASGFAFLTEAEAQKELDWLAARRKMIDTIRIENFKANCNKEWNAKETFFNHETLYRFVINGEKDNTLEIIPTDIRGDYIESEWWRLMISNDVAKEVRNQLGNELIKFVITGEK